MAFPSLNDYKRRIDKTMSSATPVMMPLKSNIKPRFVQCIDKVRKKQAPKGSGCFEIGSG